MTREARGLLVIGLLIVCADPVRCQTKKAPSTTDSASASCFGTTAAEISNEFKTKTKDQAIEAINTGMYRRWNEYVCYLTADSVVRATFLGKAEEQRQDKQSGATSNSSGSTSLVSKGSSPSIIGLALEHGALTQTTSGNTITFRGNLVNSITALMDSTYLGSYQLSQSDPVVKYLAKLSFGVSFDTTANQPSTTQGFEPTSKNFSGFSAKYEIYNDRDPRNTRWRDQWNAMASKLAYDVSDPGKRLNDVISAAPGFDEKWESSTHKAFVDLKVTPTPQEVQTILEDAAELFRQLYWDLPEVQAAVNAVTAGANGYVSEENKLFADIRKTPIVTVEYTLTRQLTTNDKTITATEPNQKIPDLSNVNLVLERGFASSYAPELTFNVSGTWFNSPDTANPDRGRVRDIRASLEADWQLTKLTKLNLNQPTLSLSGQYLNLLAEPLGQMVTLNGVTIDRRGPMEVFQAKLSIPAGKSSGVKIPLSFTYASRTELVKESDVRGNIGITFDLDTLFSQKK